MRRKFFLGIGIFFLCACLTGAAYGSSPEDRNILRLAYTDWSSSIAASNLVKAVVRDRMGMDCELIRLSVEEMYSAVASGKADAMVSAWLPQTHESYFRKVEKQVVDLGPNLEGTRTGLVVPNITEGRLTAGTGIRNRPYMDIDTISELRENGEKLRYRIIGIDPGAGIMLQTREAMDVYGLENFNLVDGSEVSMLAELSYAIRHQQWIVITGWLPHWMFARWDLKFLDDPEGVYTRGGSIHTIVRQGLEEDMPEVYGFLDRFHWKPEEMGQLMLWNQEEKGLYPYDKALRWIRTHPERVRTWLK